MDSETLRQKISQTESAKLGFKIKLHEIFESANKDQQWAELVKDILALANGNFGTATDTGYLIVGAANERNSDGTRNLRDVVEKLPTKRQILDKVTSYCHPPSLRIQCDKILLDGKNLFVVSIFPSPYLYSLTKPLKTPKTEYSCHAVLLRRHDGEGTYTASSEEQEAIRQEKQGQRMISHTEKSERTKPQNRVQLSPEVYDRKIAVYRTANNFLVLALSNGTVTSEQLLKFTVDTNEALFIFNREVADYLHTIFIKVVSLYSTHKRLENSRLPVGEERSRLAEENSELLIWLSDQFEVMRTLFHKYISL